MHAHASREQGRPVVTRYIDPCENAARVAEECMMRSGDRDSCLDFFQAYRDCKGTWLEQRRNRHRKPPPPRTKPPQDASKDA